MTHDEDVRVVQQLIHRLHLRLAEAAGDPYMMPDAQQYGHDEAMADIFDLAHIETEFEGHDPRVTSLAAYIESLEAEVKRSHDAILALTGTVERLEAERDDYRAKAQLNYTLATNAIRERDALLAEMESFVAWADSYPKSVWHEPNAAALKAAHDALKAAGLDGIDALSAMLYRHALKNIGHRARAAIAAHDNAERVIHGE